MGYMVMTWATHRVLFRQQLCVKNYHVLNLCEVCGSHVIHIFVLLMITSDTVVFMSHHYSCSYQILWRPVGSDLNKMCLLFHPAKIRGSCTPFQGTLSWSARLVHNQRHNRVYYSSQTTFKISCSDWEYNTLAIYESAMFWVEIDL